MNLFTNVVEASDDSEPLDNGYTKIQENLKNRKSALGGKWNDKNLMAMFFHHYNKRHFHQIANAIDARISIDPTIEIKGRDILEIAHRLTAREQPHQSSSVMAMNAANRFNHTQRTWQPTASPQQNIKRSFFVPPAGDIKFKRYPHPSTRSEAWSRQWLSPEHPCVHCWEWGHWAQDCPRKRAGKPAAEDPRIRQPDFKLRKSAHVSHPVLAGMEMEEGLQGAVASIERSPANNSKLIFISRDEGHAQSQGDGNNQIIYPGW
ncbi:hypothetical protein O181_077444 [Austropuccinia psidii MF-1]|uniref:CCHC-type domain-containing protein n=1 Tax=Austropuccinia psidii MF-1 TaxID=1389203 RepID=A0A9Q3IGC4_9BASI|nr:hypothetical protein [Austropuccinia psidii MF-1]